MENMLILSQINSDIIKYYNFSVLSSPLSAWVPNTEKSIYLTAVQVSAPLPVSIILNNNVSNFLVVKTTESSSAITQRFPSPYKLGEGTSILVSTSNEAIACSNSGATTATQVSYNGRSDFTSVNNAMGLADGNLATLNSLLISQASGRIVLGYALLPNNYNFLQIQKVIVKFYCRLALTLAVGVSSMILYWRPSAADSWIELQQLSLSLIGSINNLTNPIEVDITAAVLQSSDPWSVINGMQTSFVGSHTGLGLGNSIQLDAVEVNICTLGKNQLTLFGFEA